MEERTGGWKQVLIMLAVVVAFAFMNTMIKKVIDEGMDRLVLITLRQLVATLFIAPIAYLRERKTRPKLTASIFVYLFFSALFGASLTQYLFFIGLQYTSVTFACAFLNMTPVMTFLIALPFGMETLNVKTKAGAAKLLGTAVCLSGAMLLTFYKGTTLTHTLQASAASPGGPPNLDADDQGSKKWMVGSVTLMAGCISWSSWFVLQTRVGKKYPALYSGTTIIFFLSFLQAAAMGLATHRGFSVWVIRTKLEIATVFFAGIVGSGFGFLAMSWCVEKRGPVFTTSFTPLVQMIVAVIDVSILQEPLHLGSVLGSALVIAGLYFLLWGKTKESHGCATKVVEEGVVEQGQGRRTQVV